MLDPLANIEGQPTAEEVRSYGEFGLLSRAYYRHSYGSLSTDIHDISRRTASYLRPGAST